METKISIITVVYNGAKTLDQTINSVINQTFKNFEYIIIDGGSTDGTLEIIEKYKSHITTFISEKDGGLYDAMNKGISLAKGEIIGMINSDDWYESNALEIIHNAYLENPTKKIFHGDRYNILEDGTKTICKFNPSKIKFIYYGMTYNHPSMFVHRDIYAIEKYNTKIKAQSDYEFTLKNYIERPNVFLYIPNAYVNYRLDGISGNMPLKVALQEGYITRKNAGINNFINYTSIFVRFFRVMIYRLKK